GRAGRAQSLRRQERRLAECVRGRAGQLRRSGLIAAAEEHELRAQRRPKSLPRCFSADCGSADWAWAGCSAGLLAGLIGGGGGSCSSAFDMEASAASVGVASSAVAGASVGAASSTFLMRESSNSRVILSLTSTPPESSFVFQVTPQSLR